jgi:hypothetical protein
MVKPLPKENALDKQLQEVKSIEKGRIPYQAFFDHDSDTDSSGDGVNLSSTEKTKFIRLMNPNYQFTQLQVMNDYLNELKQKADTIKDMVEANQIALAPEGSLIKLDKS